jgi:hypothetical protein
MWPVVDALCAGDVPRALLCAAGCGGDPPERRAEPPPAGVRLTCDDAIQGAGPPRATRGSITLGPVELAGLGRLRDSSIARRGGVKIPLLVEPWNAVTIRIVAPRGALGFIPHPPRVFPPGRPSSPLPEDSSSTLTTEGCAPRPGSDPRSFLPSFVAIARPACARFEVRDARGSVARRTVSIGAGGSCRGA